jgi:hypothetical protein
VRARRSWLNRITTERGLGVDHGRTRSIPNADALVVRGFAVASSLFTGALVGAVSGLVAWGVGRLVPARSGAS